MEDIQDKVFSDFEVPSTSDGSYRGRKNIVDKTNEHVQMKFEQELPKVNQRLKSSKTKVSISTHKGGIQLVATLPLKPGDTQKQGRDKKQYKISLGIPANFEGLKTAEEEAQELGKLIARQTFTWTDKYLGVQAKVKKNITFRDFYEKFENAYFSTRKKTRKSTGTFEAYKSRYKCYFLCDKVITENNLKDLIKQTTTPGARKDAVRLGSILAGLLGIEASFNDLVIKSDRKKRDIPSDSDIQKMIHNFQKHYKLTERMRSDYKDDWLLYKLVYGLMATYGLRPREIVNQLDIFWILDKENKFNTIKVHSDNKTGYREVFPFVPEWIELFDLENIKACMLLKKKYGGAITNLDLRNKVNIISKRFKTVGIPFQPYDLRHACAIRAHLQGVPVKAAADNLGHTVEVHTRVYQHWFGLENRRKAFIQTFENVSEVDRLKDELAQAKQEITSLKAKLARFELENMI